MKTPIVFLVFIVSLFSACNSSDSQKVESAPVKRLVILIKDDSSSRQQTASQKRKEKDHIKRLLRRSLIPHTDIALMRVNSYSADRTNTRWIRYVAPKRVTTNRVLTEKQQELNEVMYATKQKSVLKRMTRKAIKELYVDAKPSQQTAIIELFQDLVAPLCTSDEYAQISIVVLSDMIQESKLRDFTKPRKYWPMPSKEFAISLAKKDVQFFKDKGALPDFSKVHYIEFYGSTDPDNSKYYTTMPFYWDQYFDSCGYKGRIVW